MTEETPEQNQSTKNGVPIIGLLGGVASGKSLVAQQLAELGAGILDGDRTGHEVLRLPEVVRALRQRWGDDVLNAQGEVDRSRVTQIVFAPSPVGPRELAYLEQVTHPKIGELLSRQARQMAASGRYAALVLDAPMMLESGWHTLCNHFVFVEAPHGVRLARAMVRGWTAEQFAAREAEQESLETKRRYADTEIDNSGTAENTRRQVEQFWQTL